MGSRSSQARDDEALVAIVTGGNRGLGLETCRQLAVLGYQVVLTSRNLKPGEAAAAALRESGLRVVAHQLDVTDPLSVERLVADVDDRYERIDVLVNNAGVALRPADDRGTLQVDIETVRQTLEVNTLAPLRLCQAVVPVMRRGGYGRVVNVSSGMGQLDDMESGWPAYRISKTALSAVTRLVAREVSGANILSTRSVRVGCAPTWAARAPRAASRKGRPGSCGRRPCPTAGRAGGSSATAG
jgi:NAD(P)-dependent dehydrogenase (short-subunit alcohol dehydrogenase family)